MTSRQKETITNLNKRIKILNKQIKILKTRPTSKKINKSEIADLKKAFEVLEKKSQIENAELINDVFKRLKIEEKEFEELANTCDNYLVENEELKQNLQHKINFYEHCLSSRDGVIKDLKKKLKELLKPSLSTGRKGK